MHSFATIVGFLFVISVCNAASVQTRSYRNTEEILVPVIIVQDGGEITQDLKENENQPEEIERIDAEVIAEDIAEAVDNEEKLQNVEAVVEAQRRLDENISEEDVKEGVQEEEDNEISKFFEEENKFRTSIPETPEVVDVVHQAAANKYVAESSKEPKESENNSEHKKVEVTEKEVPNPVVVVVESNNEAEQSEQPEQSEQSEQSEQPEQPEQPNPSEVAIRQATQATPTQTTTQQNFVQQLIQNSPLGQFFNQITGQNAQSQASNDDAAPSAPAPTLPFNPVAAVQNAAQSVVNSTTQAFAGLQQFASNLGNQFQNTLSSLGGQQSNQGANDGTTVRPPGPIQQFVQSIVGNGQQAQPTSNPQGPLQGLLNIFQGNRPQTSTTVTNSEPQPTKDPEIVEPEYENDAVAADNTSSVVNNKLRDSAEANDSFEESVQPHEIIVVNGDVSQTSEDEQENENITK